MMVTFVSQCEKKALNKTRRVLDAFADRIGDNTWQTVITQEGLLAVKKLLRKTASKNTAVSCFWIRSRSRSELVWVVGNRGKFNSQGNVSVNSTEGKSLQRMRDNHWHTAEYMTLLASIAALFHDFGKANQLFQNKINPDKKTKISEPYRHEWVSLRLFESFVRGSIQPTLPNDKDWLTALSEIQPADEKAVRQAVVKDQPAEKSCDSPFKNLPPVAKAVAWLILTHHKLPQHDGDKSITVRIDQAENHIDKDIIPAWNSPQINTAEWKKSELNNVWQFKQGLPIKSNTWCYAARGIAEQALKYEPFSCSQYSWLNDKFTLHMSRLSLMLADHLYSSLPASKQYQDRAYKAYANSDRESQTLKQKLDEHLIGVYKNSQQFTRNLPNLKNMLPTLGNTKALKERSKQTRFKWQNKAFDVAAAVADKSEQQGFFGVNMASTGKGKTLANAKIMCALSNEQEGCRFSIALGLRALTLQTGGALSQRLKLDDDDIAVLIGSQAVQQLYDQNNSMQHSMQHAAQTTMFATGSESADDLLDDNQDVLYEGELSDDPLTDWLAQRPKLNKLLNAPILACTIDHLMPATEAARGGKQIAPMLRLLTSDLVLDEPDDFDIADLPALTRLVNWAGLLGSRIVLSSATLPPDIIHALFESYQEGRQHFNKARTNTHTSTICCAWFDDYGAVAQDCSSLVDFSQQHLVFVKKRVAKLQKESVIHRSIIASMTSVSHQPQDVIAAILDTVTDNIYELHNLHAEPSPGSFNGNNKISIGLVRMANINPLVALASALSQIPAKDNYQLHLCIYHSQYPLIVRSAIEKTLDAVLDRSNEEAIWQQPVIKNALKKTKAEHHIFIVLSTSVAEVGRDWDLDWAIAEPSSARSIIQLAGRVQRHRRQPAANHNLVLLNSNYRALNKPNGAAFCRPGFESHDFKLSSHQLDQILTLDQYQVINSIPRIEKRKDLQPKDNLVDLEHHHLYKALFEVAGKVGAHHWWNKPCDLTYMLQQQTPFRASSPSSDYYLQANAGGEECFYKWHPKGESKKSNSEFERVTEQFATGVTTWAVGNYSDLIERMAEQLEQSLIKTSMTFGAMNLREDEKGWQYSAVFGVYQALYESAW